MGGSGSPERLRNLSKGTWTVKEGAWVWTQMCVIPKSILFNMLLHNCYSKWGPLASGSSITLQHLKSWPRLPESKSAFYQDLQVNSRHRKAYKALTYKASKLYSNSHSTWLKFSPSIKHKLIQDGGHAPVCSVKSVRLN